MNSLPENELAAVANALRQIASSPMGFIRDPGTAFDDLDSYLVTALRGFAGTRVGAGDREAANALVAALIAGCASFAHYSSDIVNNHPDLSKPVVDAISRLPQTPVSRERLNFVENLTSTGHFDDAAKLFITTVLSERELQAALNDRASSFDEFERTKGQQLSQIDEAVLNVDKQVKELVGRVQRSERNAEELSRVVSNEAAREFASAYATQSAIDDRRAGRFLRYTFGLLFAGVSFALLFAVGAFGDPADFSTGESIAKAGVALGLFGAAGVCGRIASEFRSAMWHWKHTQLQLQLFFPFIDRLPIDQQSQIIGEMTERFFPGQANQAIKENPFD